MKTEVKELDKYLESIIPEGVSNDQYLELVLSGYEASELVKIIETDIIDADLDGHSMSVSKVLFIPSLGDHGKYYRIDYTRDFEGVDKIENCMQVFPYPKKVIKYL